MADNENLLRVPVIGGDVPAPRPTPVCPICGNSVNTPMLFPNCELYHIIRPPEPGSVSFYTITFNINGKVCDLDIDFYSPFPSQSIDHQGRIIVSSHNLEHNGIGSDSFVTSDFSKLDTYEFDSDPYNATGAYYLLYKGCKIYDSDNKPIVGAHIMNTNSSVMTVLSSTEQYHTIDTPIETSHTDTRLIPKPLIGGPAGRTPHTRDVPSDGPAKGRLDALVGKHEPLAMIGYFGIDIKDNTDDSITYHTNTGTVTVDYDCGTSNANKYATLLEDDGTATCALSCVQCDSSGVATFTIDKFSDYGVAVSDEEVDVDSINNASEPTSGAETWVINDGSPFLKLDFLSATEINFTSNNMNFAYIGTQPTPMPTPPRPYPYGTLHYNDTLVAELSPSPYGDYYSQWQDQAYRTVTFETAPTGDLLTWLQSNAVKLVTDDLTGWTWVGNETIDTMSLTEYPFFNINFTSNDSNYTNLNRQVNKISRDDEASMLYYNTVRAFVEFTGYGWDNQAYKTIRITGGTDATNTDLIKWLQDNGTLTPPVTGYSITYHADGGTPEPENLTGQTSLPSPLPTIAKDGYNFDGWFYDSMFETQAVAGDEINADTDLYAKFTRSHVIKYYVDCTESNPATQVAIGDSYTNQLTPDSGFMFSSNAVSCTMGGIIVAPQYNADGTVTINIAYVTDDIIISAPSMPTVNEGFIKIGVYDAILYLGSQCVNKAYMGQTLIYRGIRPITEYSVTVNIIGGSYLADPTIKHFDTKEIVLFADDGYVLPPTVTIGGATLVSYDKNTGIVTINNAIGNVTISAVCIALWQTPTITLNDDTASTEYVDGVTKYKVYEDETFIGYVDEFNEWHQEVSE